MCELTELTIFDLGALTEDILYWDEDLVVERGGLPDNLNPAVLLAEQAACGVSLTPEQIDFVNASGKATISICNLEV